MKRIVCIVAMLLVAGVAVAVAQQSSTISLGDAARKARASRQNAPVTRVYTNDDLPKQTVLSTNTADNLPKDPAEETATKEKTEAAGEAGAASDAEAAKDRAALEQDWRKKIGEQKAKVAQLQGDVNRIDREMKMQGTVVAFANSDCLNFPQRCADTMKAYQDELASKQQQLQDETEKLDSMREELRRAGLPASWGD